MNYQKRNYVPPMPAGTGGICPKKSNLVDELTAAADRQEREREKVKPKPRRKRASV